MQVHIGEMLEGRFSAVGEASLKLCPRKVKKRKGACTNRARVPAESARNGKAHVQTEHEYLRKVRETEKCRYKPDACTCENMDA